MKSEPLVSIIIPVYNGANYLEEAIESALHQTYKNCEIIIVNDGSNDGGKTESICRKYENNITYICKENGGVASAINRGISEMKGDYFAWLSHDDLFVETKIEKQVGALSNSDNKNSVVFGNFTFRDAESGEENLFDITRHCNEEKIENGIYPILFGLIHFCTVLVSKARIREVGACDESLKTTQDMEWLFRLLRNQHNIFISEPLTIVRTHREQGKRVIKEYNREQELLHLDLMKKINPHEIQEMFGDEISFYWQLAKFYERDRNRAAYEYARDKFNSLSGKVDNSQNIVHKICEGDESKDIVIFGCGYFGGVVWDELRNRGVKVKCFSDNNPLKWETDIKGLKCISHKFLDKDSMIIVAIQNPIPVMEQLCGVGFRNVRDYRIILNILDDFVPNFLEDWQD